MSKDPINPEHYTQTYPMQVIDIIQGVLSPEQFDGYCLGNELKYRLRAGFKGDPLEDIKKALWYNNKRRSETLHPRPEPGVTYAAIADYEASHD